MAAGVIKKNYFNVHNSIAIAHIHTKFDIETKARYALAVETARHDGLSRRLWKTAAVETARRDGQFRYHMQFQHI